MKWEEKCVVYRAVVRVKWDNVGKNYFAKLWRTGVATDLTGKRLSPYSLPPALKDLNFPALETKHINYTYGAGISESG